MKKEEKASKINRKKIIIISIIILVVLIAIFVEFYYLKSEVGSISTGKVISQDNHQVGPSTEEQQCMITCMGCSSLGVSCTRNQQECQTKCNMQKPESTEETSCMEKCVATGCGEFDFNCQNKNKETCEKDCNMLGDKPDESEMSAEQLCITNCVAETDPSIRCGNSQTGETGGEICQRCVASCVHLYAGPCLDDEKLKVKQKECETCEHCYGEPVMGDSGEGWECIVSVECKDASSEFGDNPGTGLGIGQEGFIANVGDVIGNVVESIGNFFKGIFGGGKSEDTSSDAS